MVWRRGAGWGARGMWRVGGALKGLGGGEKECFRERERGYDITRPSLLTPPFQSPLLPPPPLQLINRVTEPPPYSIDALTPKASSPLPLFLIPPPNPSLTPFPKSIPITQQTDCKWHENPFFFLFWGGVTHSASPFPTSR